MRKTRRLLDEYRFLGFRPKAAIKGIFGEPGFRVIQLERRQKKLFAVVAGQFIAVFTIGKSDWSGICPVAANRFILLSVCGGLCAAGAGR
jgi:hypothetical protein